MMEHGPAVEVNENPELSEYKTKIGLRFFAIYGSFFAGFVIINTFVPGLMKIKVLLGLNLAVTYGFALIIAAIIMGLIYNMVCTKKENEFESRLTLTDADDSNGGTV
jgi:uncharacterized membrane protein (DUF485 family)